MSKTKKVEHVDSMVLGAGHSLMVSNIPNNLPVQVLTDNYIDNTKVKETLESYGFFGSGLDYNTFYPDVTSKDFNPEEDEFIEPVFRMISSCIVAKAYNPTDFSKPGVLKSAMNLLLGQTVNCDHETDVGNAIGAISEVAWQDSYTDPVTKVVIPGGINAKLKIDARSNPRIARGINMDPPSIHSNSVTVQFLWQPSHGFEGKYEFYEKLGTIHPDGTMVRRIVTKIISFKETSLVSHGADPFAQIIKDGKIINPSYAGAQYYSFSEEDQKKLAEELKNKMFNMDFKKLEREDEIHNTCSTLIETGKPFKQTNNKNMEELQKFMETLFSEGLLTLAEGVETPTTEMILSQVAGLVSTNSELSRSNKTLEESVTTLTEEKNELTSKLAEQEKMANIGVDHLTEVRDRVLKDYQKLSDTPDENIIALINAETTNLATLLSLGATYEQSLNTKYPQTCSKCGSKDISRASSVSEEDGEGGEEENKDDSIEGTVMSILNKKE